MQYSYPTRKNAFEGIWRFIVTKVNPVVYNKLLAQMEEAKERKMTKLASRIGGAIGSYPAEEAEEYPFTKLEEDIHQDLWKSAARLIAYYDLESVDAEKVDQAVVRLAEKVVSELEDALGADGILVGALEPKVPGESK
jgi:hypothetical protein